MRSREWKITCGEGERERERQREGGREGGKEERKTKITSVDKMCTYLIYIYKGVKFEVISCLFASDRNVGMEKQWNLLSVCV